MHVVGGVGFTLIFEQLLVGYVVVRVGLQHVDGQAALEL